MSRCKKYYTRQRLEYSQKIKEAKMKESYFDGGILDYIGYSILVAIIFGLTLGIATPWAVCMMQNWKTKHTVVNGQRLYFDGTGAQLFGN